MQRRKTKKGFWWWSWLLIIFIAGGTVGGWFVGQKLWDIAPKEYRSTAKLRAYILPAFLGSGGNMAPSSQRDSSEMKVLRDFESVEFLTILAQDLKLGDRWGVSQPETIKELRNSILLDLNKEKELFITIQRDNPEEAAEIVNYMAPLAIERLEYLNGQLSKTGLAGIEAQLALFNQAVSDSHSDYVSLLRANGVDIVPEPGMNLNVYNEFGEDVLRAQVTWAEAVDDLKEERKDFGLETSHWKRKILPSSVLMNGEVPMKIHGPKVEPYHTRGAIGGLSLGILFGLLAMLMCWKLFS